MTEKPRCYPVHDPSGKVEKHLRERGRYRIGLPITARAGEILWVQRIVPTANPEGNAK